MSVNIVPSQQPSTWWQRLTGTEPKTVVHETSTTTITSDPGGSFNVGTALRNGGIGAAIAGALGGVSLLGKVALPLIGKIGSLGGLVRLAGVGGMLGVATAALPLLVPKIRESPAAKAALTGAAVGAAAGAVLPFVPITLGAAVGAGVGLLVHHQRNRPAHGYRDYPGYDAYPGYQPYGMPPGGQVPNGLVPVTPNYGAYAGTAVNPYGNMSGYGYPQQGAAGIPGYGYPQVGMAAPGYGYGSPVMSLPMQAGAVPGQQVQPGMGQVAAVPAAAPVGAAASRAPKFPNAKTFIDAGGNVRQLGTGKVLGVAAGRGAGTSAGVQPVATAAAAPLGLATMPMLPSAAPVAMPLRPTA